MKTLIACLALTCVALVAGCRNSQPTGPDSASPLGKTVNRSIDEFVNAQHAIIGWYVASTDRWAIVDYGNVLNRWIEDESAGTKGVGTTWSGTVTERELADGRALISVNLHTKNALGWAEAGWYDPSKTPIFGAISNDILDHDATPALGESHLMADIVVPHTGMPLPDLTDVAFGLEPSMELKNLSMTSTLDGPLHANFGVAEGTPGRMVVDQIAPLQANARIKGPTDPGAHWDGFPVEKIDIKAIGH